MGGPHTRGFAATGALHQLDRFERGLASRVRPAIPAASLAVIDDASSLQWVPWEHEHHTTEAVFEILGDHGVAYFRWLVSRHLVHVASLAPFMRKVQRLFGLDPGSLLRICPAAFDLMFRGCGRLEPSRRDSHTAQIDIVDCAPEVFTYPSYIRSWAGAFEGVLDIANFDGEVRFEADEASRRLRYVMHW